ncbi:hypothetical protein WEI85_34110 [Actinomycetes bacterium KLBMP 9797]
MVRENEETAEDTVAQMRQLAVHDPEAARRLASDLMAALDRAGVRFDHDATHGAPHDAAQGATQGVATESAP